MGYEIVEQLGWRTPDVVFYPTGGDVGIIGIYKALLELRELGWLSGELPRLVAVQAPGAPRSSRHSPRVQPRASPPSLRTPWHPG
jgi:threonine synthase